MSEKEYVTTYRGIEITRRPGTDNHMFSVAGKGYGLLAPLSYVKQYIDTLVTQVEAEETVEKTRLDAWNEALTALKAAERYGERQILVQLYDSELSLDDALAEAYRIIQGIQDQADAATDQAAADATAEAEASQVETTSIIDNAIAGMKQWVFDRFDALGIDLEGIFTDLDVAVDLSLDALGIDMENIRRDLGLEIHAGLEDAGDALSTIAGSLSATAGGFLDAAMDAVSPLVEGLTVGFIGLIEGLKDMLKIDIDQILDAQSELARRTTERQIKDLVPLEEES